MGERREAFRAGQKPKTTPTPAEKMNASRTEEAATTAAQPARVDKMKDTPAPKRIPRIPPIVESTADSIRN